MPKRWKNYGGWQKRFKDECLSVFGQHILEIGITGSGKTQGLYWILEGLSKLDQETLVWLDTGKSSEILTLALFKPLRILIPYGFDIDISLNENFKQRDQLHEIEIDYIMDLRSLWLDLERDVINVICLQPYIFDPKTYAKIFAEIFKMLIIYAHNYRLPIPLSVFFDEFHVVAPSKGHGIVGVDNVGSLIQLNIEKLRSLKVRFVATSQGWYKLRKGVRDCFSWIMVRRGGYFTPEQRRLNRYSRNFELLNTDSAIIVFPNRIYSDIVHLPRYPDGEQIGNIRYLGIDFEKYVNTEALSLIGNFLQSSKIS